jgi:hypothetical protein
MAGVNQKQLRQQFWADNPQFKKIVSVKVGNGYKRPAGQNDYPSDVRLAWCVFFLLTGPPFLYYSSQWVGYATGLSAIYAFVAVVVASLYMCGCAGAIVYALMTTCLFFFDKE